MKPILSLLLAPSVMFALYGVALADDGAAKPQFASFTAFAGSDENLQGLVTGLRNDTPITLTSATQTTTFDPPTKPMGFGNVRIALTLARAELKAAGVPNPTPQQIQAALMGGTVITADGKTVALRGVLQLRSQGKGWGQIRQTLNLAPTTFAASSHAGAGITTALGPTRAAVAHTQGREVQGEGRSEFARPSSGTISPAANAGIVTAAGAPAGAPGRFDSGHGGGSGRGR